MKLFVFAILSFACAMFLIGCSGGGDHSTPPPQTVSVLVSPTSISLFGGDTQQFTATVSGSSNRAVTWSLHGTGCSGASCGAIDSSGMYTAPSSIASTATVQVMATAVADTTKSAAATASLVPISVSISPSTASVYQRDMTKFTATVNGSHNTIVTWSIGGMIGGGCSTGYIFPSGLYTTSYCDIFNAPQTFEIVATAGVDSSKTATAHVTVTGNSPHNSQMNGEYAFLFKGYDLDGRVAIGGRVTADGAGGLIAGTIAMNRNSNTIVMSGSGNYSIGSDGRGTLFLNSYLFRFVIDSTGMMRIIEFDETLTNPIRGSGEIKKQDPTAFSLNQFTDDFALQLGGELGGSPLELIGQFNADTNGTSHGQVDLATASGVVAGQSWDGTLGAPDAWGFGTATFTSPGIGGGGPLTFAYFIVSASEAYLVETDARSATYPLLSGKVLKQSSSPFANTSFNGSSVLQLTGAATGASGSHAILGQAEFDGNGHIAGIADDNRAGVLQLAAPFTGTYSIAANGRGTADIAFGAGGGTSFTFYVIDSNRAFVFGGTPSVPVGEVVAGTVEPQTGAPFSPAAMSGTYATASLSPATSSVKDLAAVTTLNSNATFFATMDACTVLGCTFEESLVGTFAVQDATTGRGTVNLTGIVGPSVFYVVSPTKVFLLNSVVSSDNAAGIVVLQK